MRTRRRGSGRQRHARNEFRRPPVGKPENRSGATQGPRGLALTARAAIAGEIDAVPDNGSARTLQDLALSESAHVDVVEAHEPCRREIEIAANAVPGDQLLVHACTDNG